MTAMSDTHHLATLAIRAGQLKKRVLCVEKENLGGTYPFPGTESIWFMKMAPIPGFDGYPWAVGLRAGPRAQGAAVGSVAATV